MTLKIKTESYFTTVYLKKNHKILVPHLHNINSFSIFTCIIDLVYIHLNLFAHQFYYLR